VVGAVASVALAAERRHDPRTGRLRKAVREKNEDIRANSATQNADAGALLFEENTRFKREQKEYV
jgi:hypothetical protein